MKHYKDASNNIFGFMPYQKVPAGLTEISMEEVAAINAEKAMPKTPEEIQQAITTATQQRLDDFARTRGYDGIMSACTYATSTNAKFSAEGQYCVEARDATWATLHQMIDAVLAGARPMPSGYADIEPELPVLVWPV